MQDPLPLPGAYQSGAPGVESANPRHVTPPSRQCGLDEVGRGALAGPLVAAAVVLPEDITVLLGAHARYLRDSKTVPRQRRSEMSELIHRHALAVEIVAIPIDMINRHGIGWANREAFARLIACIGSDEYIDEYIIDGRIRPDAPPDRAALVRCLVKADALVPAVAAASLVAKVYRDAVMEELHRDFPRYGWDKNSGYGTAFHLAALREFGTTPEHRTIFVRTALSGGRKRRKSWPSLLG